MRKCGKRLFTRLCKPLCFQLKDAVRRCRAAFSLMRPAWARLTGAGPVTKAGHGGFRPKRMFLVVFFVVSSRTLFSV
jgi:hypothetical protein